MERLSLLMFSRNDVKEAVSAIRELHGTVDDILIIDSSDKEDRLLLKTLKKRYHLNKLRIFDAVAFGWLDPLRNYGIKTCKCEWVLYLDAEEKLNSNLKKDIKQIITETKYDGLLITRVHYDKNGAIVNTGSDKLLRLYKRDLTQYAGRLHESATVNGRVGKLPEKYCIVDEPILKSESAALNQKILRRYMPLEMLTYRLTYSSFLILVKSRPGSWFFDKYIKLKMGVSGLMPSDELTKTDYELFELLRVTSHVAMSFDVKNLQNFIINVGDIFGRWNYENAKVKMLFKVPEKERKLQLAISSEIIKAGGVINYLNLNDEKTVREVNKKYMNYKPQGVKLFEKVLKDRYFKGTNYY